MTRIAFIGLGNMGGPMAANLVKAGHTVTGFDLSHDMLAAAEKSGVKPANVLTDAIADAEVIITMLQKGAQVLTVWGDITRSPAKDTLVIDCSTIDVDSARQAHAMAKQAGCLSLD